MCPMFLYWPSCLFVSLFWPQLEWDFKCWCLKCFVFQRIPSLCRSTNKIWYFFHITFQSDSHFLPFWTDFWKQKVRNVLCFHCANWNKNKFEPLASYERLSREISQGSCLWKNIFFSMYSMCDHQSVADIQNRCPQLAIPQFLVGVSWRIYSDTQLLLQEWISGQIYHLYTLFAE